MTSVDINGRPVSAEGESDKEFLVRLNAYSRKLELTVAELEKALMHADGFRSAVNKLYRDSEEKS